MMRVQGATFYSVISLLVLGISVEGEGFPLTTCASHDDQGFPILASGIPGPALFGFGSPAGDFYPRPRRRLAT